MSVTYVYRIPLYHAYEYSLVYEGSPRPDELDEDGVLHQILTYDGKGRLVCAEQCVNGAVTVERRYDYADGRLVREEERYRETGTGTETVYRYREGGYSRESLTDGTRDFREEYILDDTGRETAFRKYDADDELVECREKNERGDVVLSREAGVETRYEYGYRPDGRVAWKKTMGSGGEIREEFLYTEAGVLMETVTRDGEREIRELYTYEGSELVKSAILENGVSAGHTLHRKEGDGRISRTESYHDGELIAEYVRETGPDNRYLVERSRERVPLTDGTGRVTRVLPVSRKLEVVREESGRITDVLTCDRPFQVQGSGLECDANAYFFLEYEA